MRALSLILLGLLRLYKLVISPALHLLAGPSAGCRFSPTCSEYAAEALQRHGPGRGLRLAARRLCRCHPWGQSGWDPVPGIDEPGRAPHPAALTVTAACPARPALLSSESHSFR